MTRVTLTLCCMFCFHLLFAAGTLAQEMRLWVDITGKHKLIGEFVGENDGIVTLKMKDKTEVEIPLDKLSDNDQKHVAKLKEADGDSNPFQKKGESNPFMKKESSTSSSTEPAVDLAGTGKVLEDDYTKARDLSVGGVIPTTWDIELQPGSFAAVTAPSAFRLPNKSNFFSGFKNLVTNPTASHAIIGRNVHDRREDRKSSTFILVELNKPRYAGHGTVDGLWYPLDLDESGKMVLARNDEFGHGKLIKLNLFQLGAKGLESVVEWEPYLHSTENRDVKWAAFTAYDQVVTMSGDNELVFWSVPEVRPLARMKMDWAVVPQITPDGKYVLYGSEGTVGLIDIDSHEIVATRSDVPRLHGSTLSLSPSGKRIAVVGYGKVVVWELPGWEQYRELNQFNINSHKGPPVWIDDQHMILGSQTVVDLENRIALWNFDKAERVVAGNGFAWFFVSQFGNRPAGMVGGKVPNEQIEKALQQALDSGDYFVLQPRSQVKVVTSSFTDSSKAAEAKANLEEALKTAGYTISDQAEVTAKISVGRGESREITYRSFGEVGGTKYTFTPFVSKVIFEFQGKEIWQRSSASNVPFFLHLKKGESVAQAIKGYEKPNYNFFKSVEIPKYVPRPRDDNKYVLGETELKIP